MKLAYDQRLPLPNQGTAALTQRLYEIFREISKSFNSSFMWAGEGTSAPASGTWATGDKVKNTNPSEAGTAGSKYVVIGWIYVGGSWKDMRVLTGA